MGVAAGQVTWGAVGANGRLEMTVIGPAVNLSAKLEKHNKKLSSRCIVEAETWRRAQAQGYEGLLDAKIRKSRVEGVSEPVEIAVLSLRRAEMPKVTRRKTAPAKAGPAKAGRKKDA